MYLHLLIRLLPLNYFIIFSNPVNKHRPRSCVYTDACKVQSEVRCLVGAFTLHKHGKKSSMKILLVLVSYNSFIITQCLCTMFMDCIYVTSCSLVAHGSFLGPSLETNFTGYWHKEGTAGRTVPYVLYMFGCSI